MKPKKDSLGIKLIKSELERAQMKKDEYYDLWQHYDLLVERLKGDLEKAQRDESDGNF